MPLLKTAASRVALGLAGESDPHTGRQWTLRHDFATMGSMSSLSSLQIYKRQNVPALFAFRLSPSFAILEKRWKHRHDDER
jgi:hypothetical protein